MCPAIISYAHRADVTYIINQPDIVTVVRIGAITGIEVGTFLPGLTIGANRQFKREIITICAIMQ